MDGPPHRISIGMPVYNGERYIRQTIDSILAQTDEDFELIISDNASTDCTSEICREVAARDSRIRYYRNSKNLGAAPNYNQVFKLSRGEYFKWADYDDLIAPSFLAKCAAVLDENPDVVLCYPAAQIIGQHGERLGDYAYKIDASSADPAVRFRNAALNLGTAFEISGLIRASAIRKTQLHGSFPASDLVFLAELALYGRFYQHPEILFYPRFHPEQSIHGALRVERDRVVFFDTANAGKILLPKWQYLGGHLRAIQRSPLNPFARAYCYIQMVRWVAKPDHFRALGKDVWLAGRKLIAQRVTAQNALRTKRAAE